MQVLCQSNTALQLTITVRHARNDSDAARQALAIAERDYPGQGWRALLVL